MTLINRRLISGVNGGLLISQQQKELLHLLMMPPAGQAEGLKRMRTEAVMSPFEKN